MNDEANRDEQVETLEWAGGNTVVNCHDSGITLAGSLTDEYNCRDGAAHLLR